MTEVASLQSGADRRDTPRYAVHRTVWISMPRLPSVAGSVVNISASGCAVRVPMTASGKRSWPLHRTNGDEISLFGLLRQPVACWVVAVDSDILRLRFLLDNAVRDHLERAIAAWTATERG